jgi:hypothetical protein
MPLRSIRLRLLALVLVAVIPFAALIGVGIWNQQRDDRAAAISRAMHEARLLAVQVDDHIGNLEHLLTGLSLAVSTNSDNASANDTLLRQAKARSPSFFSHIMLFSLDGNNIGTSWDGEGARINIADYPYFREVLAGQRFAVGDVHVGRVTRKWVVNVARAVEDRADRLQAVIAVGTWLEHLQDALRVDELPPGSVVRIVNQHGIVVAQTTPGPDRIGRDLGTSEHGRRPVDPRKAWRAPRWRHRLAEEGGEANDRRAAMRSANPAFIPRNHLVEEAISAAVNDGYFSPFESLLTVLSIPYEDQPAFGRYVDPPRPDQIVHQTFCGT